MAAMLASQYVPSLGAPPPGRAPLKLDTVPHATRNPHPRRRRLGTASSVRTTYPTKRPIAPEEPPSSLRRAAAGTGQEYAL